MRSKLACPWLPGHPADVLAARRRRRGGASPSLRARSAGSGSSCCWPSPSATCSRCAPTVTQPPTSPRQQAEVDALAAGNVALEQRIQDAGTPEFIEREARKLGLVQPGERLFIITGVDRWKQRAAGACQGPVTMIWWTTGRWSPGSLGGPLARFGGLRSAVRTAIPRLRSRRRSGRTASPSRPPTT